MLVHVWPWNCGSGPYYLLRWIGCLALIALSEEALESALSVTVAQGKENHKATSSNPLVSTGFESSYQASDGEENTTQLNQTTFNTLEATQTYLSSKWESPTHLPYEDHHSDILLSIVSRATRDPTTFAEPRGRREDGFSTLWTTTVPNLTRPLSVSPQLPFDAEMRFNRSDDSSIFSDNETILSSETADDIVTVAYHSENQTGAALELTQTHPILNVTLSDTAENVDNTTLNANISHNSTTVDTVVVDDVRKTKLTIATREITTKKSKPNDNATDPLTHVVQTTSIPHHYTISIADWINSVLNSTKASNFKRRFVNRKSMMLSGNHLHYKHVVGLNDTTTEMTSTAGTKDETTELPNTNTEFELSNNTYTDLNETFNNENATYNSTSSWHKPLMTVADWINSVLSDSKTYLTKRRFSNEMPSNNSSENNHFVKKSENETSITRVAPPFNSTSEWNVSTEENESNDTVISTSGLHANDTEEISSTTTANHLIENSTSKNGHRINTSHFLPSSRGESSTLSRTDDVNTENSTGTEQMTSRVAVTENGFEATENVSLPFHSVTTLPKFAPDRTTIASNDSVPQKRNATNFRISGVLKIVEGLEWVPELLDSSCDEYRMLSHDLRDQLENVFSKTMIGEVLKGVFIQGFSREGSVIVEYSILLAEYADTLDRGIMIHLFNSQLRLTNGKLGKYTADLGFTNFEVPAYPPENVDNSGDDPPVPQWAIAVIVIAAACLIFFILFGAVTIYGRSRTRTQSIYDKDQLVDDGRDWETYLAAAYENLAADSIYDIREKDEKNRRYSQNCRTMADEDWPNDFLSANKARRNEK